MTTEVSSWNYYIIDYTYLNFNPLELTVFHNTDGVCCFGLRFSNEKEEDAAVKILSKILNTIYESGKLKGFLGEPIVKIDEPELRIVFSYPAIEGYDGTIESLPESLLPFQEYFRSLKIKEV